MAIDLSLPNEYPNEPQLREFSLSLVTFPCWVILVIIRFYQMWISPTLPSNTCRFYPSCSHYGYQAIYKYGLLKGGLMAMKRIIKCNPFNSGGFDPVY